MIGGGVPNLLSRSSFYKSEAQTRRLFVLFNLRSRSSTPFTVPDIITLDQISSFVLPSLEQARYVYDSISSSLLLSSANSFFEFWQPAGGLKDNISRSYNGMNSFEPGSSPGIWYPPTLRVARVSRYYSEAELVAPIAGTRES